MTLFNEECLFDISSHTAFFSTEEKERGAKLISSHP